MSSVVVAHIDEFAGAFHKLESGFDHRVGIAHKGNHGAVSSFAGIYVQHFYAFYALDGCYNGINHGFVPPFTIVGDTFDELFHGHSFNAALKIATLCEKDKRARPLRICSFEVFS